MDSKVVIIVTAHIGEKHNNHFFLHPVSPEHAKELNIPNLIEYNKDTKSFVESMSVIQDKFKKIQEILNED